MMLQRDTPLCFGRSAHVVDMAACYEEPVKFNGESVEILPLDSVTVATSSETTHSDGDDSSSCSSVSCDIQEESNRPRSIFGSYWVSQGYESSPFYRSVPEWSFNSSNSGFLYQGPHDQPNSVSEAQVPIQAEVAKPPFRRSIFGNKCVSKSERSEETLTHEKHRIVFRKTKSAPILLPRSAMRPGRFSGNRNDTSSNQRPRARSVSFNDHVVVAIVPAASSGLVERFAEEGWSDWFA